MNKINLLTKQAILAAKKQDWPQAVEINQQIIQIDPQNLGALNRIGLAYLQNKNSKKAKQAFKSVLSLDPNNNIAHKNLAKIKNKQSLKADTFSKEQFIEEPGLTKIVDLHRLASKKIVEGLSIGQSCDFKLKKRFISVEVDQKYIGSLPEDLSFRLSKLIQRKNKYQSFIYSASCKGVKVYIKEIFKSKRNQNITSFPINKENIANINDIDEKFLLDEEVPIEIVHTDEDAEDRESIETAKKQG